MDAEDENTPTTRLLTLLNVSALKSRNRPSETPYPREKLNKRRHLNSTTDGPRPEPPSEPQVYQPGDDLDVDEQEIDEYQGDQSDLAGKPLPTALSTQLSQSASPQVHNPYDQHFGSSPEILTEHSRMAVDQKRWKTRREKIGKLHAVASVLPETSVPQKKRAKKSAVRSMSHIFPMHVIFMMSGTGTPAQSFRGSTGQATTRYHPPSPPVIPLLNLKQNTLGFRTTYSLSFLLILMSTMLPLTSNITNPFVR